METFSALLALCDKGQWRGALMFYFIYAWINDWVNNREAGDLRRQDGHYDVIVMRLFVPKCVRDNSKYNIQAQHQWLFVRVPKMAGGFP